MFVCVPSFLTYQEELLFLVSPSTSNQAHLLTLRKESEKLDLLEADRSQMSLSDLLTKTRGGNLTKAQEKKEVLSVMVYIQLIEE